MTAIHGLDIVIDQGFVQREVERIVESEFFRKLMKQVATMKCSRFGPIDVPKGSQEAGSRVPLPQATSGS